MRFLIFSLFAGLLGLFTPRSYGEIFFDIGDVEVLQGGASVSVPFTVYTNTPGENFTGYNFAIDVGGNDAPTTTVPSIPSGFNFVGLDTTGGIFGSTVLNNFDVVFPVPALHPLVDFDFTLNDLFTGATAPPPISTNPAMPSTMFALQFTVDPSVPGGTVLPIQFVEAPVLNPSLTSVASDGALTSFSSGSIAVAVPEPSSIAVLGLVGGAAYMRRRRKVS